MYGGERAGRGDDEEERREAEAARDALRAAARVEVVDELAH